MKGLRANLFYFDEVREEDLYTEEFDKLDEIIEARRGMKERLALEVKGNES